MTFLEYYESLRNVYNDNPYELTDKGGNSHTYIQEFYDKEFTQKRYDKITLVEIGVWRGKSLELFDDWFINGKIIGIDYIDHQNSTHFFHDVKIEMKKRGVELVLDNAYSEKIVNLFEDESIDYLIDDGCHSINNQIECVKLYYPKIKKGGKLIIEDISDLDENISKFYNLGLKFDLYDMRWNPDKTIAPHLHNNVLIVYKK